MRVKPSSMATIVGAFMTGAVFSLLFVSISVQAQNQKSPQPVEAKAFVLRDDTGTKRGE